MAKALRMDLLLIMVSVFNCWQERDPSIELQIKAMLYSDIQISKRHKTRAVAIRSRMNASDSVKDTVDDGLFHSRKP